MIRETLDEKNTLYHLEQGRYILTQARFAPPIKRALARAKYKVIEVDLRKANDKAAVRRVFSKAIEKTGVSATQIARQVSQLDYLYSRLAKELHTKNTREGTKTAIVFHVPEQWSAQHPAFQFMESVIKRSHSFGPDYETVKTVVTYPGETPPSAGYTGIFGECHGAIILTKESKGSLWERVKSHLFKK